MADQSDRWGDVAAWVTQRVARLGKSPEQLERDMPRERRVGAKTIRKLMAGERAEYRVGNVAVLAELFAVENDWLDRLLAGERPRPRVDGAVDGVLDRLRRIEADLERLNAQVFGAVVPLRPRKPERPPPAAPAQPRPKAARETKGKKRPGRPGTSTRPQPDPEPDGP